MRLEIPALIVVEAPSAADCRAKALELSQTLREDAGPGAFFYNVGIAPTGMGRPCEGDRDDETVNAHVQSLLAASPVAYVQP